MTNDFGIRLRLLPHLLLLLLMSCLGGNKESEFRKHNVGIEVPEEFQNGENFLIFSPNTKPPKETKLAREQEFGDIGDLMINFPGSIQIDDADKVYIADIIQGHTAVHVFNPDGSHLTTIGGNGEGPGEFRSIGGVIIQQNELVVYDGALQRISFFTIEESGYALSRTVILNPNHWTSIEELEGTFLSSVYFFLTKTGNILTAFQSRSAIDDHLRIHYLDVDGRV